MPVKKTRAQWSRPPVLSRFFSRPRISFLLLVLLLSAATASFAWANYWTIEYAPSAAGVVRGDTDDDLVLSVKGASGSLALTDWFANSGALSSFELDGDTVVTGERMARLAVLSGPDIDVTPISCDTRIVPDAGQIEVSGTDGNDYIFGNAMDNVKRGLGGSNVYYCRTGDGHDEIVNTREPGHGNVLRFHTDIDPSDVNLEAGV